MQLGEEAGAVQAVGWYTPERREQLTWGAPYGGAIVVHIPSFGVLGVLSVRLA